MTQYQPTSYPAPPPAKSSNTALKVILIIVGSIVGLTVCCCGGLIIWGMSMPDGGVRTGQNMEQYATDYINSAGLLDPGESIAMYYDETANMDSKTCAILTDQRLIYHTPTGNTTMAIGDIVDVTHNEVVLGEVITVKDTKGQYISFEVFVGENAPLFISALEDQVDRNKQDEEAGEGDVISSE